MILLKLKSLDKFLFSDLQVEKSKTLSYVQLTKYLVGCNFNSKEIDSIFHILFHKPGIILLPDTKVYEVLENYENLNSSSLFTSMFKKLNYSEDVGYVDSEFQNSTYSAFKR